MHPVVIVFARAPRPGHVKTRLQPALTAAEAASLHVAFTTDTILKARQLTPLPLELHTDEDTDAWSSLEVTRRRQAPGDLGTRMYEALRGAIASGAGQVLIAGSDAPAVPLPHLRALIESPAQVALGAAQDGGYYAIAARDTSPGMFDGVNWSGPRALAETVANLDRHGLSYEIGPEWFDVDTPADLLRLARLPQLPPYTAAWLRDNATALRRIASMEL